MAIEGKKLTRKVLSGFGIMGGSQIVTILCSVVRAKLVALWIGPAGFGLLAIYLSVLELISQLTSLGIRNSAVRDVAANVDNRERVARVGVIVARWGAILALLGFLLTALASPLLSLISFGDTSHILAFCLLGLAVAFSSLSGARLAVLQGLRRLSRLGKATVSGAVTGLLLTIPLFYYWRAEGILPSLLVFYGVTALVSWLMRERFDDVKGLRITRDETLSVGRKFLLLGFFITLSEILNQLAVYLFISWLNVSAGDDVVGFYQAGNTLFNRYVGVVFMAVAMEYYPRLTSVIHSRLRVSTFVAHEMKLTMWILLPAVLAFAALAPLMVRILYATEFLVIVPFVTIAVTGTILRAVSWCLAMVILARGDGKMFMVSEGLSAIIAVGVNILGYKLGGLVGLGFSYVAWYAAYTVIVAVIYRFKYRLTLNRRVLMLASGSFALAAAVAGVTVVSGLWWPAAVMTIPVAALSLRVLRRA